MALSSPLLGVEPDSSFMSKTVKFNSPKGTSIKSPIPGYVTADVSSGKVTVQSNEGTKVVFEKVGTVSVGSSVGIGSSIGLTGDENLEFTVYNKNGNKVDAKDFLKNTDPSIFSTVSDGNKPKDNPDKSSWLDKYSEKETTSSAIEDIKKNPTWRFFSGISLAPFHLASNALGLNKSNTTESKKNKENIINEEIERIKKLMK